MFFSRMIKQRVCAWFQKSKILEKRIRTLEKQAQALRYNMQTLAAIDYSSLRVLQDQRSAFRLREFNVFSQNGEDGILLYIFSMIGARNHQCLEIGIQDGKESNTANLIINFGWRGVLVEGNKTDAAKANLYYDRQEAASRVSIIPAFVTVENIAEIFLEANVKKDIDLFSLDIDGNDWWIWQSIERVRPRVVVVEYNASFGPERSATVRYDPSFVRRQKHPSGYYHGASLTAFARMGKRKGYTLVACDSSGCNAFFVRTDVLGGALKEVSPREAYYPHARRIRERDTEEQFAIIKDLPLEEIP